MGEKQHPLYTGRGDHGFTQDLFGCRIPKKGLLFELFGKIDRLQADVDKAILKSSGKDEEILEGIQKKLWQSYAMIQDPENKKGYIISPIEPKDLRSIENYVNGSYKYASNSFVRFTKPESQILNDCRIDTRDAEVYLHRYIESSENQGNIQPILPAYFNRLSSFFYAMALKREHEDINKRE